MRKRNASNEPAESLSVEVFTEGLRADGERSGRPVYRMRTRVPFRLDAPSSARRAASSPAPAADRAAGEETSADSRFEEIEGPSSSTSVDWYGTRMGLSALESMAAQFAAGVDYLPRHPSWLAPCEWYDQIGRTVGASIRREPVKEPAEGTGPSDQAVLYTRTRLWLREPLASKLLERIDQGEGIPGQSIGGWFTEIRVSYDEEGYADDIEILDVELDHLAAVRSPANPDADRVYVALAVALFDVRPGRPEGAEVKANAIRTRSGRSLPLDLLSEATRSRGDYGARVSFRLDSDETAERSIGQRSAPVPTSVPSSSEQGNPQPTTETTANAREEVDMDPTQLAEMFRSLLDERLTPMSQRLDAIDARTAPPATPNPTPAPAPSPAPAPAPSAELIAARATIAALEARAAAAEAIAAAAAAGVPGQRSAAHTPPPPAAGTARSAADIVNELRQAPVTGPGGINLREVAPNACGIMLRSAGEVQITPQLVADADGLGSLAQICRSAGDSRALADLVIADSALSASHEEGVAMLAARFRGPTNRDRTENTGNGRNLTAWQEGENLLRTILRAAQQDGIIGQAQTAWS